MLSLYYLKINKKIYQIIAHKFKYQLIHTYFHKNIMKNNLLNLHSDNQYKKELFKRVRSISRYQVIQLTDQVQNKDSIVGISLAVRPYLLQKLTILMNQN